MSSKERAKGFFQMNHLRPVSSEVALEVRRASCAHSNLQTPQKRATGTLFIATLGDTVRERASLVRGITEMSRPALARKAL